MNIIKNIILLRQNHFLGRFSVKNAYDSNSKNVSLHYQKSNLKIKALFYHENKMTSKPKLEDSISKKIIGSWLLTCSGMVFVAVTLGGVTRLTESGLSMVTWKVWGEKIPFDESSWIIEFEKYKKFPEYKINNKNMTLEEFKKIWWMEYIHRMWGRLIGAAFIIPASYFWFNNMFKPIVKKKILIIGILINCQGLMGWYMVKSGLENKFKDASEIPRVSQYRLASHLGLALMIYSGLLHTALDHILPWQKNAVYYLDSQYKQLTKLKWLIYSSKGLIFLTAISGAFVAGLDAGLIYNSFPKMADRWIPDDLLFMTPVIRNFTENPTTVQFNHRILGFSTLSIVTLISLLSRKLKLPRRALIAVYTVSSMAYLQATLGILTLLNYVPTYLATLHQSGSLLLLSTAVWLCHEMKHLKILPK